MTVAMLRQTLGGEDFLVIGRLANRPGMFRPEKGGVGIKTGFEFSEDI